MHIPKRTRDLAQLSIFSTDSKMCISGLASSMLSCQRTAHIWVGGQQFRRKFAPLKLLLGHTHTHTPTAARFVRCLACSLAWKASHSVISLGRIVSLSHQQHKSHSAVCWCDTLVWRLQSLWLYAHWYEHSYRGACSIKLAQFMVTVRGWNCCVSATLPHYLH